MATAVSTPDLRPLSLSELLDRIFTYYRRRFWLFVGIMAIPQAFVVALNLFFEGIQQVARDTPGIPTAVDSLPFILGIAIGVILFVIIFLLVSAFAWGAATYAVSEVHLGRTTTIRRAYDWMRGRLWRLIVTFLAVFIRMMGVGILVVGGIVGIASGGAAFRLNIFLAIAGIALGILGMIAGGILWVVLALRYSLAASAVLLENMKPGEAIRRSVFLARGNLGKIFLLLLLMSMLSWTASAMLQGPFLVAAMVFAIKNQGAVPFWLNIPTAMAGGIGQSLTAPLVMIGFVLLYYDARVRKEGFDLQLIMDSLDQRKDQPAAP
jgi:hypothetical protein